MAVLSRTAVCKDDVCFLPPLARQYFLLVTTFREIVNKYKAIVLYRTYDQRGKHCARMFFFFFKKKNQ